MKTYTIPEYKIIVNVADGGVATIESGLQEALVGSDLEAGEFYAVVDAIESLILAHAQAGIDINSPAYVTGLKTCLEAIANNH
jgi:hypothetical protein